MLFRQKSHRIIIMILLDKKHRMLCPPSLSTPGVSYVFCIFAAMASVVSARVVIVIAVDVVVIVVVYVFGGCALKNV